MGEPKDIVERSDLILNELATLGLGLARDLAQRATEAEDADLAARLAVAFHHVSRSVRQALALQARLERDRARASREDRAARVDRRKSQLRAAVGRTIREGFDPDRAMHLACRLDERIYDEAFLDEAFPDRPVDDLIARLRKDLGLAASSPAHPREGGDPGVFSRPRHDLGLTQISPTSSSGLSRGPMNTAAAEGVATAPPTPEPPTCMDPRDKPEDDGAVWGIAALRQSSA